MWYFLFFWLNILIKCSRGVHLRVIKIFENTLLDHNKYFQYKNKSYIIVKSNKYFLKEYIITIYNNIMYIMKNKIQIQIQMPNDYLQFFLLEILTNHAQLIILVLSFLFLFVVCIYEIKHQYDK